MADLKKEYAAKLEKALGDVDFSKVFRIESQSEMLQYDMDKQIFPLKGLWCPQIKTDQPDALAKIGFCKWDDIRFLDKKVQLPEKKNKVYHNGDIKSMSLADLYGKMAIEAQIIKMDVYHLPFLKISDFELFYNYLGSIEVK